MDKQRALIDLSRAFESIAHNFLKLDLSGFLRIAFSYDQQTLSATGNKRLE